MSPLARSAKQSYTRLKLLSKPVIALPLIVVTVFLIASIAAYFAAQGSLDNTRDKVIERQVQENMLRLTNRLSLYNVIASSGAGFASTNPVTNESWATFYSSIDISDNFPSINALTYAAVMSKDDAQTEMEARNAATGSSELQLDPNKLEGDPYILTQYAVPDTPAFRSRLGIDEYAIASRKEAIERAIKNNHAALTRSPQMLQPADDQKGPKEMGLIIFAPIYDRSKPLDTYEQRKAALIGTSNVSFRANPFFDSIYADVERQNHTFISVYQGDDTSAAPIYSNGVMPKPGDAVHYVQKIPYAGQTFTYVYEFSDSELLTLIERDRPTLIIVTGILLGGLLSIILLFGIRGRLQKISLEKEREIQLAKDELLSLASHQLRTPATGVKQYVGMVLQGFAGDISVQQKEFLQKAYDSNDRQLHIINDILHLAKLDAGRIVLSKTSFDMAQLVRSVLDEQHDAVKEAEVTLTAKLPKRLRVYADEHMMRMVIENIVSNAIKYTHPGGRIKVGLTRNDTAYSFTVTDTGVGIAEENMDKLFKQFSRIDNERSHLVSGTGVGLYLVKNLVELHGGEVSVVSKPNKGTTFTVVFDHETGEL